MTLHLVVLTQCVIEKWQPLQTKPHKFPLVYQPNLIKAPLLDPVCQVLGGLVHLQSFGHLRDATLHQSWWCLASLCTLQFVGNTPLAQRYNLKSFTQLHPDGDVDKLQGMCIWECSDNSTEMGSSSIQEFVISIKDLLHQATRTTFLSYQWLGSSYNSFSHQC